MEDYQQLLEKANIEIENMPKNVLAYRRRGVLKMEYEDYAGAIEDFTAAIKMKKRHAWTWLNRGMCHYEIGEYQCAMYDYRMAFRIRPNMSVLHCEIARVYVALDNNDRAMAHCKKAIRINRNNFDALTLLGYCWMETKLPSLGLPYLNRALKLHPFDAQAMLFRGMIYHKMEKWPEALEDYDLAIAFGPEETAYLNRAVVKMEMDRYQSALEDAHEALKISEDKEKCYELIEFIREGMEGEGWKG